MPATHDQLTAAHVAPDQVHKSLGRHLLVDGFKLVLDTAKSAGSWLVDARTGERYLDFYTFFASAPLGTNPPGIVEDAEFMQLLADIAANKPANSDVYSTAYAEFVATFSRVLGDPALPHLFFIEGGGLAVENALKTAFDWKSRQNEAAGRSPELGTKVLHLTGAFHGRTGYTMSLTNPDPNKTARFPKFDWPRVDVPAVTFPLDEHHGDVEAAERHAIEQAKAAFEAHPHDIACFIAEPIQGEGGDNHMRAEFLRAVQDLCHAYDALFVLDEVQTGLGTGTAWAYQQLGLAPDIVAFAKKVQLGGIMAGRRVDDVADNVFRVSSRINSTWGGGLVDMVRATRLLEVIEADGLFERSAKMGEILLTGLRDLARRHPQLVSNARGRGLMCAFDLASTQARDELIGRLRDEHVIVLPCGSRSVRFRPALVVTEDELSTAMAALDNALANVTGTRGTDPA